jgi:prevent-host-death family protein
MIEVTSTEAARNFADLLDAVEHGGETFTVIRRGRAVARLAPVSLGQGSAVKSLLQQHMPDEEWAKDVAETRALVEIQYRQ